MWVQRNLHLIPKVIGKLHTPYSLGDVSVFEFHEMSPADDVCIDIEPSRCVDFDDFRHNGHRCRRSSGVACSNGTTRDGRIFYFSEIEHEHFPVALMDRPHGTYMFSRDSRGAFVIPKGQPSFYSTMVSDLEDEEIGQESGGFGLSMNNAREDRSVACRICHMNLEEIVDDEQSNGNMVELGCNCKGELGVAHKKCAETWFQIKGNRICEICGAIALNVGVKQEDEVNHAANIGAAASEASNEVLLESPNVKYGRLALATLVALFVLSFLISYHLHTKHDH